MIMFWILDLTPELKFPDQNVTCSDLEHDPFYTIDEKTETKTPKL